MVLTQCQMICMLFSFEKNTENLARIHLNNCDYFLLYSDSIQKNYKLFF